MAGNNRRTNTVNEDSWKWVKDLSFQVGTASALFAASATAYWFLKNQGTDSVYISGDYAAATVTTANYKLEAGESVHLPFLIGQSESLVMIAATATQTVAGFAYLYASEVGV